MRIVAVMALIALSLATSGCTTLFKDDYWDQIRQQSDQDELARLRDDPAATYFLGVRATATEAPYQVGIAVQHVYAESPAAKAGLRAGDEIRVIDQYPVRTPGDVRWVLSSLWKSNEAEETKRRAVVGLLETEHVKLFSFVRPLYVTRIVYSRDGREVESRIDLTSREAYLEVRRRRVLEYSRYERSGWNGVYLSTKRTIPPELIADYFGVKPFKGEDVVVSEDFDLAPLLFGISIYRKEEVPVAYAMRVTVICSLFQFSSRGDDVARTLTGIIPDPPEGSTDL